ncbi:MAG: hypothetical protein ACI30W_04045, partial [Muribaculaceae bacterium]
SFRLYVSITQSGGLRPRLMHSSLTGRRGFAFQATSASRLICVLRTHRRPLRALRVLRVLRVSSSR